MKRWLLAVGPPRSWVWYLPPQLILTLLGPQRARRLAVAERDRLRAHGIWKRQA